MVHHPPDPELVGDAITAVPLAARDEDSFQPSPPQLSNPPLYRHPPVRNA
jgi:hypothetical protein